MPAMYRSLLRRLRQRRRIWRGSKPVATRGQSSGSGGNSRVVGKCGGVGAAFRAVARVEFEVGCWFQVGRM